MSAHAPCPLCGGPVVRRPDEDAPRFRKRRCCCPEHSKELRRRNVRAGYRAFRERQEAAPSQQRAMPLGPHDYRDYDYRDWVLLRAALPPLSVAPVFERRIRVTPPKHEPRAGL